MVLDNKNILSHLIKTHKLSEIAYMFNVTVSVIRRKIEQLGLTYTRKVKGYRSIRPECAYFPCHDKIETCEMCYCKLYTFDCGGKFVILPNGIKDCSNCIFPHTHSGLDNIKRKALLLHRA